VSTPVAQPVWAGCGAGSFSAWWSGWPREVVVVGAGGQVPGDASVRGEVSGQAPVVHEVVVVPAQQGRVGQVGGSAVEPVSQVVRVAPLGGHGAPGEGAAAVAQPQRLGRAGVKHRVVCPRSRTWLGPPSRTGMIAASQASRRTVPGASSVPASGPPRVAAAPSPARSWSRSMLSSSWVLAEAGTPSAAATPRRTISTRASPGAGRCRAGRGGRRRGAGRRAG